MQGKYTAIRKLISYSYEPILHFNTLQGTVWIPWLEAPHQPLCKDLSSGVFFYQFEALKKKKIPGTWNRATVSLESCLFSWERSFWGLVVSGTNGLYPQAGDGGKLSLLSTTGMNSELTWRAWDPELEYMHWRGWLFSQEPKIQTSSKQWLSISPPCDRVIKLSCSSLFSNNLWPGFCAQVSEVRHSHLFSFSSSEAF